MILDYENGIRGRITRAICQCGETKDTMHGYDETRESAQNLYRDFNNQYKWALL